jgi:hypothetical protein
LPTTASRRGEERFLVLPHPEVLDYLRGKAADVERWLGGMRRLRAKSETVRQRG